MRSFAWLTTAFALGVCLSPSIANATPATIYVRTNGSNLCDGTVNAASNHSGHCAKKTIQAGIGAVAVGGTVRVAVGTYRENVLVDKSVTVQGANQATTIVQPALSAPNPCANSSLCGGAASNVFLVRASDVTIASLTVNGDNPTKNGVNVGGANIDARNGIIEDHLSGVYNHLNVHDVTVKNVFLRGINAGSGGNDFSFQNNTVTNVQGGQYSVGVFAFDARGLIQGNKVSHANDAISLNYSRGVKILNNTVSDSGSGIHIDNNLPPAAGIADDRIQNNIVKDCTVGAYGIWMFVPTADALVDGNQVTHCQVGLALIGGGASSDITFSDNAITGDENGVAGILVSTDTGAWGHFETEGLFSGNTVKGFDFGAGAVVDQGGGKTATAYLDAERYETSDSGIDNSGTVIVYNTCLRQNQRGLLNQSGGTATVHVSSFADNAVDGVENLALASVDATENWWNDPTGPAGAGETTVGPVNFEPHLFSDPVDCN